MAAEASSIIYCRALKPGERLDIFVNSKDPATIWGNSPEEQKLGEPVNLRTLAASGREQDPHGLLGRPPIREAPAVGRIDGPAGRLPQAPVKTREDGNP